MRITIVAHASVLIEMGPDRILIDPIFDDVFASGTLCFHPARRIDQQSLVSQTTHLVITHIHLDHFHPATLARFPRQLPVIVPPHDNLVDAVRALGFTHVTALEPWSRYALGAGELLATPSDFELEELGLVAISGEQTYWHMSDAIVTEAVGKRVRDECGPVSALALRYQPLRTLIGYQRGLQAAMLDRDEMAAGFEAACAAEPAYLFPYFSGFAFHAEHAWANRHIGPYNDGEIARLLHRRLGAATQVDTVLPGDQLQLRGRSVTRTPAAAHFVHRLEGPSVADWEPIDTGTLNDLATPAERVWLTLQLRKLLAEEVMPWVMMHLEERSGLFDLYSEYQAVWQGVIHLGEDHRLHHCVDFRGAEPQLRYDVLHPDANVFSHISGRQLLRVLRGQATTEVFWMAGGYRMYEKLMLLDHGRFREPPIRDWELFDRLPDPITHYLRKAGRRRLVEA